MIINFFFRCDQHIKDNGKGLGKKIEQKELEHKVFEHKVVEQAFVRMDHIEDVITLGNKQTNKQRKLSYISSPIAEGINYKNVK